MPLPRNTYQEVFLGRGGNLAINASEALGGAFRSFVGTLSTLELKGLPGASEGFIRAILS